MKELLLSVIAEEIAQSLGSLLQFIDARQIDHTEVIGGLPMEAAAVGEKNLLLLEEVKDEFLVVSDIGTSPSPSTARSTSRSCSPICTDSPRPT